MHTDTVLLLLCCVSCSTAPLVELLRNPSGCILQAWQRRAEQREELKQAIALAATRLLQEPEAHGRAELPRLVALAGDADAVVRESPLHTPACWSRTALNIEMTSVR